MRLKLSGSARPPGPILLNLANGVPFIPQTYIDQGYTDYEVLCVGGAGGYGTRWEDSANSAYIASGAGGGGGLHRVQGYLSGLPSSVAVVVGAKGADAVTRTSTSTAGSAGSDGTASSFNGTTCRASGGKGGLPSILGLGVLNGLGGAGGVGGTTTAGGGGASGTDGTWSGTIGGGGGGGRGGYIFGGNNNPIYLAPTKGGRGSWNSVDKNYFGTEGEISNLVVGGGSWAIYPGPGGGAKALLLNGLNDNWGSTTFAPWGSPIFPAGVVLLRLTT